MLTQLLAHLLLRILWIASQSTALPENHTDSLVNAIVDGGAFANPSPNVRPKFRYWLPDASVDPNVVAGDVEAAGTAGAAGLELLGYYLYGGPPSNGAGRGSAAPVSWATYGFGTQAWHTIFQAFAQAHKDNNLIMDFALGPNQGTGVPATIDSDGLMWDLAAFNVSIPVGGTFNATLPGWGTGKLQAAVTGLAIKSENITTATAGPSLPGDLPLNRTQITLSASSLADVTSQVGPDGHLSVQFDSNVKGINNLVFVIYLISSEYRAQDGPKDLGGPQTPAQTIAQNGSWAVDHFSSLGAKTMTDFWEQSILINGTKQLLMEVGNYAWEDSVEIEANVYWTKNFSQLFSADHGYSIAKWLPILFHRNGHAKQSNPHVWWITDEPDGGNAHIADYRSTLAEGYRSYLEGLNSWAEQYLNLQFSAQISYNLPMDMLENIPVVDAPECESLDFSDLIDGYRQYAGPANLAGKRVVSSECGAVHGEAFFQTLPELLWHVKRSYAGSVNQFVFHGFPYSGQYGNTTWPVFTTFNYQYSNMHGPHEPAWEYYKDQLDYVARNNLILQSGTPKFDIAFWQKMTVYPGHIQVRTYQPGDLEAEGYTYEYLSPGNFDLPSAIVNNGTLAPDAQAFKAMVVRGNDSLTVEGALKLVDFAKAGLPIVFSGGLPSAYLGVNNNSAVGSANQSLNQITSLPNVHVTGSYDGLAATIQSLGIVPTTKISTNGSWFTLWRSDKTDDIEYFYIYNDAMNSLPGQGSSEGTIEFQVTGIPYEYDAWTGDRSPILVYSQNKNSTTIPFQLAGNQSTIVAFLKTPLNSSSFPSQHLTNVSSRMITSSPSSTNTSIKLQCGPASSSYTISLSSGKTQTLSPVSASPTTLSNWTLVVEHWDPPDDLHNITAGAKKSNTTHQLLNLTSWQSITGLQNVSGRGFYSTSFIWPPSGVQGVDGAVLNFGPVVHTLQASVNGHPLPPLDVTDAKVDIGSSLIVGLNRIEAVVSTTLSNVLRPIWDQLESSGTGPNSPGAGGVPPPVKDYGLLWNVTLTPYRTVYI